MQPAAARPVPASKLSAVARKEKSLVDKGVTPPLPSRFVEMSDGIKLRVRAADALTKDWRVNHDAARPGSMPAVEPRRPEPPKAYFLPKAVLERMADELLTSQAFSAEYATSARKIPLTPLTTLTWRRALSRLPRRSEPAKLQRERQLNLRELGNHLGAGARPPQPLRRSCDQRDEHH